ncbi:hypothetical protein VTJ04DRAFT_10898 [Mycothermus thermophilus]|uniref:uncharacterized protein n=1 Tax=Humicola insolens TaxID=85995 RepID=UPI003744460E
MAANYTELPPGYYPGWMPTYETCDEVTWYCPIEYTTLGYAPNYGLNIFLAVAYGLAAVLTIVIGVWKKTWAFSIPVGSGCILECTGYIGRSILSHNVWNGDAFKLQIVAIVLGPTLVCAGLYLTLGYVVEALDRTLSRFPPRFYPIFFIPADVSCLVIQAIGGGIAAAAGYDNPGLLVHGNRTIMAGVALQVVVLAFFGLSGADFLIRARKSFKQGGNNATNTSSSSDTLTGSALLAQRNFRLFLIAVISAYSAILIRCIYRIAEMAGGWANPIMQHESSFVVLESFMVLIACWLLSIFAPGIFFPQMAHGFGKKGRSGGEVEKPAVEGDTTGAETA